MMKTTHPTSVCLPHLLVHIALVLFSLPPAVAADAIWQAEWIAPAGDPAPNTWIAYRKTFDVTKPPASANLRIACDSKYWLWVNGQMMVFEGGLKRGPTPNDTYYDVVDLSGVLEQGSNSIAVLVWYFGKEGMSHKDSGQPGLVCELTEGGVDLVSDASWHAQYHPAFGHTGEPTPNWRLPESNVHFDARRELTGWTQRNYDHADWPLAKSIGQPPAGPWNDLVERPVPLWRNSGLQDYATTPQLPLVSNGEPITVDLPYNAQVTPYLKVEAEAGKLIDIRTDNYRGGGEVNVRGEYVTRHGVQEYESLGWMNGHQVIYSVPVGVRVLDLKYRETGYDTDPAGSFECSDAKLNRLWQKAQRTLYLEMRDGYVDCPGRERAQWWGDITLELQQAFYALDRRSDCLTSKAMRELTAWQKPDGVLFAPIPAGNWDKELPMQMLASVGRFGFWEYYRHTGDRQTIEAVYPAVQRYMSLWQLQDTGLVVERQGGWTWGDWGENKDMSLLYNAWYYLALDGLERMAELVGDKPQAEDCRSQRSRLLKAFNRAFWTDLGYRSPDHQGPTDDRGNALAVVAGLADSPKFATIKRVLEQERHASPYMEKYVLEALIQIGAVDAAVDRMLERYGAMIDSPITTLWEGWGIGPEGYGGGSYNHAWSGGPLTLLSQYVAGIDATTPGYETITIEPRLGRLRYANAVVCSPRGEISVSFDQDAEHETSKGRVTIPEGIEATLVLPCHEQQSITVRRLPGDEEFVLPVTALHNDRKSIVLGSGEYEVRVAAAAP